MAQSIAAEAGPVPIGRPAASLAKTRPTKASNDVEEDVKLSHEIVMDQAVVANKLDQSFQALTKQLEEYKKLYQTTNQRLKEAETKRNELESKLEESSEEKAKLMEEVRPKLFSVVCLFLLDSLSINSSDNSCD